MTSEDSQSPSLHILDDAPRRGVFRRLFRSVAFVAGALLILSGIAAATLPVLVLVGSLIALVSGNEAGVEAEFAGQLVVLAVYAVAALLLGRRMARGRRGLVLYLRRFGFVDSSRALTFAVSTAIGRRWRLVTLDDALLSPVGVPSGVRHSFRLGRWAALFALAAAVVWAYLWIEGDAPQEILSGIFDDLSEGGSGNAFNRFLGALFGTLVLGLVVLGMIFGMIVIGVAFLGVLSFFAWGSYRAVRKAEATKAWEIEEGAEVESVAEDVAQRMRRLFAPRLTVVRAAAGVWQDAVLALADRASVILIDVSDPAPSLLWEVETLRDAARDRWVLVGRRDRLEALARGGDTDVAARLADILDGEEVLPYDSLDKRGMGRFAHALAGRLDTAA